MDKLRQKRGVTVIELLLAMSVFILIILGFYSYVIRGYRSVTFGTEQIDAIREAEIGIQQLTREIREASTAEDGSYALELAGDQEIIFYSDIDQDVYTERVRYTLNGTILEKGVTEPSGDPLTYNLAQEIVTTAVKYVNNQTMPIFTYYNQDYPYDTENNPLPAPARLIETKLINIMLRVNVTPAVAPNDFDVQSDVQLRNLKTNL